MKRPKSSALWLLLALSATTLMGFDLLTLLGAPAALPDAPVQGEEERLSDVSLTPEFDEISFVSPPYGHSQSEDRPPRVDNLEAERKATPKGRRYVGKIRVNGGSSTVYMRR